jgi:hypothetical protein
MAFVNRWGADAVQERFFKRKAEYAKTVDRIMSSEVGKKAIIENSMRFIMINLAKTPEAMIDLARSRYILPVMREGGIIMPHIFGVNTLKKECTIYVYVGIYKAFEGKVGGLVDVLTGSLGAKGCDLMAFVTGSRGGNYGQLAAISAHDVVNKLSATRVFSFQDGALHEFKIPEEEFGKMFSSTFDSDIWVDKHAWMKTDEGSNEGKK